MNAAECITRGRTAEGEPPDEIIVEQSGAAFIKAGWYSDPSGVERVSGGTISVPPESPRHYRYWKYEPDPASGTFACREITFREYPATVVLSAPGDEARVNEVADLADEICRNWVKAWRDGETFLDTHARKFPRGGSEQPRHQFSVEETRLVNERFALVLVHHKHKMQLSSRPIGGRATWSEWSTDPIHMGYDVGDNSCRETEYAAPAWQLWPEVPSDFNSLRTEEPTVETTARAVDVAPLTAEFKDTPGSHDGEDAFTFELRFSEEFGISYLTLRDDAFAATEER